MRKTLAFVLILSAAFACSKESFLRLGNSDIIGEYVPNFSSPRNFSDGEDTVSVGLVSQSNSYQRASGVEGAGSLGDFDYLELEQSETIVGLDTPYFMVHFAINTFYEPSSVSQSKDVLTVNLYQEGAESLAEIQLEFIDSVTCISPGCSFADSLMAPDSTFYYDVYYLAGDSTEPALYLNRSVGLVGFKAPNGETFKRLN